jgi:hypothetical protein
MLQAVPLTNDYISEEHSQEAMFATLFFGVLDPVSGDLFFINGGHEPPCIIGPSGIKQTLKAKGPVVGVITGAEFEIQQAQFEYGDSLIGYTDGVTDALSPQAKLPGLREGQTWNVRIYSPFRRPNNPTEVLQATVEGIKPMLWEGHTVDTWLVVYRSDPGAGTASTETPRVRLWVRDDGTVLKQEANLLDSRITFVRLSDEAASARAHLIGDWK